MIAKSGSGFVECVPQRASVRRGVTVPLQRAVMIWFKPFAAHESRRERIILNVKVR